MVDDHRHHRKAIHLSLSLSLSLWMIYEPVFHQRYCAQKKLEKKVNKNEDAGAPG